MRSGPGGFQTRGFRSPSYTHDVLDAAAFFWLHYMTGLKSISNQGRSPEPLVSGDVWGSMIHCSRGWPPVSSFSCGSD